MRKSYKFKLIAGKKGRARIDEWLLLCQQLYNACLEERIDAWTRHKISISKVDQDKSITVVRKENPQYAKVGSQVLQDVSDRVKKAFDGFFRRVKIKQTAGFPRLKSRYRYHSFTLKQSGWKLQGKSLKITNIGKNKLRKSREIQGKIKTVQIKKDIQGNLWAIFSCNDVPLKPLSLKENYDWYHPGETGIDMGLKSFLATSDGDIVHNPKTLKKAAGGLRKEQRSLARKKKGSQERNRQRKRVGKVHAGVVNKRSAFHWTTARSLLEKYDVIKNRCLSRAIADASWGNFLSKLSFKAEEAGKHVMKVNPRNTSQNCSGCGRVVKKNLSVRKHVCFHENCGLILDRDVNAAKNILRAGQALGALTWMGCHKRCS